MRSRREEFMKTGLTLEEAGKIQEINVEFVNCSVTHYAIKGQQRTHCIQ